MHSFLMMSTVHAQAALQSDTVGAEENAKAWLSLAQLILINRRRGCGWNDAAAGEMALALSPVDQLLARRWVERFKTI